MKRFLAAAMVLCLVLTVILPSAALASDSETLAGYSYSGGSSEAELDTALGGKKAGYLPTLQADGVGALLFASVSGVDGRKLEWSKDLYTNGDVTDYVPVMTGGNNNPWGSSPYFLVTLSTAGYTDITFTAKLGGTKKGPRDYKLQYSLDGETYTDVPGAVYSITDNKTMELAFDHVRIQEIADSDLVYIKMIAYSEVCIDNGDIVFTDTTGGETAVNDIVITGTKTTGGEILSGDVTLDGQRTVADVVELRDLIMKGGASADQLTAGDLDSSGALTVADVVNLRELIMRS